MTDLRPVRYRCILPAQLAPAAAGPAVHTRLLELSEVGAFVEQSAGLEDLQVGDAGVLGFALPEGPPWTARIRVTRLGTGRLDVHHPHAEEVTVLRAGLGVQFEPMDDEDLERLRDFLELLDER